MTRRNLHLRLWLVLAAALFVRAFLPQGYMPERSASGAVAVVVCGSGGVHLLALNDAADPEEDRHRIEPPCAFGLASPAVPPPPLAVLARPAPAAVAFAEANSPVAPAAAPRLYPPATGPPPLA